MFRTMIRRTHSGLCYLKPLTSIWDILGTKSIKKAIIGLGIMSQDEEFKELTSGCSNRETMQLS